MVCIVLILLGLMGCGSTTTKSYERTQGMDDYDQDSQAEGAAYRADAMHVRGPMPYREPKYEPFDFYYKHCTEIGQQTHYSKTSYDCNGAP